MGEPKIGDKLFLYGQLLVNLEEFNDYEYNALMGYATTGGYYVNLKKVDDDFFSVPGFVVDFYSDPVYTLKTSFSSLEDITDQLSLKSPSFPGTRVWTPTQWSRTIL